MFFFLLAALHLKRLAGDFVLHYVHNYPKSVSLGQSCVYTFINTPNKDVLADAVMPTIVYSKILTTTVLPFGSHVENLLYHILRSCISSQLYRS